MTEAYVINRRSAALLSFDPGCIRTAFQGPCLVDKPVGPHSKNACQRGPLDHPFQWGPVGYLDQYPLSLDFIFKILLKPTSSPHLCLCHLHPSRHQLISHLDHTGLPNGSLCSPPLFSSIPCHKLNTAAISHCS